MGLLSAASAISLQDRGSGGTGKECPTAAALPPPPVLGGRVGVGAFGICNLKSQISDSNPLPDSPPEYRGRGSLLAILFSDRHRPARRDVAAGRVVEGVDRDK